jgi:flagellar protein FliS
LQHAQEIVMELRNSLEVNAWDGAQGLMALYGWLISELIAANVGQDPAKVAACRQVIEPLRDAWHDAASVLGQST